MKRHLKLKKEKKKEEKDEEDLSVNDKPGSYCIGTH